MKYIKTFANNSEYETYAETLSSENTPNLSFCISEQEAHFHKYIEEEENEDNEES